MAIELNLPEDIKGDVEKRMEENYSFLYYKNGDPVIVKNMRQEDRHLLECKKTGNLFAGIKGFQTNGYRAYLTDKEQEHLWRWRELKAETAKFEKAKKIKFSEFKGEEFFEGENYYPDMETFFDSVIEQHGFQYDLWPKYVWATTEKPYIKEKEAYRVYEDDMDGLSEECDWPVAGQKELQKALDDFVEANERNTAFYPDYSTALLIDEQINEFKERYEE